VAVDPSGLPAPDPEADPDPVAAPDPDADPDPDPDADADPDADPELPERALDAAPDPPSPAGAAE
jgi:hypothetical protein